MTSRSNLLAILFALVFVVAACGGDDDDDAADETTTTASADDGSDGGDETTTTEAETTTTVEETTTTEAEPVDVDPNSGVGTDYCNASLRQDELVRDWVIGDPESTEQYFTEVLELAKSVDPPDEIAADFAVLIDNFEQIIPVLEDAGWNLLAVDENDPILNDPEANAASERIDAFDQAFCGDSGADDTPVIDTDDLESLLDDPELVEEFQASFGGALTEEQITCFVQNLEDDTFQALLQFGTDGGDVSDFDPAVLQEVFGVFTTCEIPLSAFGG